MVDNDVAQALLKREHQGWQSLCDGNGAAFYGTIMTGEAVMILAHGQALDREAVVASLEHAPTWDSYTITQPTVISLGEDHAMLRYTGTGRRGDEPEFVALMFSLYVRIDGAWRLAHYQQTPVVDWYTA